MSCFAGEGDRKQTAVWETLSPVSSRFSAVRLPCWPRSPAQALLCCAADSRAAGPDPSSLPLPGPAAELGCPFGPHCRFHIRCPGQFPPPVKFLSPSRESQGGIRHLRPSPPKLVNVCWVGPVGRRADAIGRAFHWPTPSLWEHRLCLDWGRAPHSQGSALTHSHLWSVPFAIHWLESGAQGEPCQLWG